MQLIKVEKGKPFTTLYYELTWPIGWEQMLSACSSLLLTAFV